MRMILTKKMAEKQGFTMTVDKTATEITFTLDTKMGMVLHDSFQESWGLTDRECDDVADQVVTRAFGIRVSRMFQ